MESIGSEQERTRRVRRTFTKQFKAELVAKVDAGEQSTAQIALEHNINANLLHKWVTKAHEAHVENRMVPVTIHESTARDRSGTSFELDHGCGTFRFSAHWDPASVALLIKSLG